jgi:hypothetical protein
MISIVYVSASRLPFTPSELEALLAKSRANNQRDGISGVLLYRDGDFLQVLEGPEEAVRRTYARIARDPRHGGVIVLDESEITQRHFGDWSMGFRRVTAAERPAGFVDFFDRRADLSAVVDTGAEVYRYLQSFRALA